MLKQVVKVLFSGIFWFPVSGFADTTLDYQDGDRIDTIKIKGQQLKASSQYDTSYAMLYNAADNSITMLDHKEKTVMHLTESTMRTMGNVASTMQDQIAQQLEAQMANLSPQERAQMEQMMGAMMPKSTPNTTAPKLRIVSTGKQSEVNGWACEHYAVYQGQEILSDACMSAASKLDVSSSDYAVMRGFIEFTQSMASSMPSVQESGFPQLTLEGDQVPVSIKTQSGRGGNMLLKRVSNDALAAEEFAIPVNYRQQSMMDLMR